MIFVFLMRSFGTPNSTERCFAVQCYDKTWATLAQSKMGWLLVEIGGYETHYFYNITPSDMYKNACPFTCSTYYKGFTSVHSYWILNRIFNDNNDYAASLISSMHKYT